METNTKMINKVISTNTNTSWLKIIVFLGMITENINIYDKNYLHMIYRNCVKNKIKNISVFPYIPIYNIIKTYLENNFAIQIIYL